jgi:hypothetical protein
MASRVALNVSDLCLVALASLRVSSVKCVQYSGVDWSSGKMTAPGLNSIVFEVLVREMFNASISWATVLSLQSYSSLCLAVLSSRSCASMSFRVLVNVSRISAVNASSLISSTSTSSRTISVSRRPVLRSRHSPAIDSGICSTLEACFKRRLCSSVKVISSAIASISASNSHFHRCSSCSLCRNLLVLSSWFLSTSAEVCTRHWRPFQSTLSPRFKKMLKTDLVRHYRFILCCSLAHISNTSLLCFLHSPSL